MDGIYRDHIIDHYQNPRNFGPPPLKLREGELVIKVSEANSSCGDMLELFLVVRGKGARVVDVGFQGLGCAISTAAGSLLTEAILGKTINEVKKFSEEDMMALLGIEVSPTRMKCATLPLRALQKALRLRSG